jgi:uncharacterized protein (TIGR02996 family)
MSEEESFLQAIGADPADDASRLVYADWLDEHGGGDRAAFLRAECSAAAGKPMHARTCRRYAKALPEEWLRSVARPCVSGTVWVARDSHGPARIWFLADGNLRFERFNHGLDPATQPAGSPGTPGDWQQVGSVVMFNVNDYSDHFGRLDGERMVVRWTNQAKQRGSWIFRKVQPPSGPPAGGRRRRKG